MTMGIENLKKIVAFAGKNESLVAKLLEGGVTKEDIVLLPEFVMALPELIQINWAQLMPRAKDVTPEEVQELIAAHNAVFDLPNDKLERTIEESLALIASITASVFKLIALFK
jgi:hypothetical protein